MTREHNIESAPPAGNARYSGLGIGFGGLRKARAGKRADARQATSGAAGTAAPDGGQAGGQMGGQTGGSAWRRLQSFLKLPASMKAPSALVKRILPRSLLARALLIMVTPVIAVQAVSAFIFFDRHYDTTTRRLSEALAGEIAAVVELLETNRLNIERAEVMRLANDTMGLRGYFEVGARLQPGFVNPDGTILERHLVSELDMRLERSFAVDALSHADDVIVRVQMPDGLLVVEVNRKRLFSTTTYLLILWMVGTSIVLFAVATIFMRNQVRPIRRLALAAERFGKGRDVADFHPSGAQEVRQAAYAFLLMRERIKRQIMQRTEMLAGVSHDLRTPLTRMKLQLAMLGDSPEVENLKDDVTEMERMVEGYLAFARGEGTEQPQQTDLVQLLRQAVEAAEREGAVVDLHVEQSMTLPLRREAMRRCVNNLIRNARQHGRHVWVSAGRRAEGLEILIDDDGPGIPADKREDVFRPFFRLDESRNPATGGTGLGLTIARDVVRGHGGELTLDDAPGGGLRVRILLPR